MAQSLVLPAELEEVRHSLESVLHAQAAMPSGFKFDLWLEEWLTRPHPALGGFRPTDLLATPEGIESVRRVLGAMISGAYQ